MAQIGDMDWFGLMRGITELHVKSIASPALASEDALAGTESGGEHPKDNSSPLHKFAGERAEAPANPRDGIILSPVASRLTTPTAKTSPAIHSGDTIDRLMDAVAVCEERSRR